MNQRKIKLVIKDKDWPTCIYRTKEWEDSVNIIYWEHDYVKKVHVIIYSQLNTTT